MILSGLQPTNIQQNGRMLLKMTILVLIFALSINGCSADWWVGDGRGDWTLDLYKGYAISKINSKEILIVHKENSNDFGGSIVISNYFVIAYQLHNPYICLKGIRTQKMTISDNELYDMMLSYFLINTTNHEVIGPSESYDDFAKHCNSLALEIKDEWIKVA